MPIISMFYGIIIRMFNMDNRRHHKPHVHAEFQGELTVFDIETGEVIEGNMPGGRRKLVEAWIEIHRDELLADWKLAIGGEKVFKIKPLD